jgi:hypothetical protein
MGESRNKQFRQLEEEAKTLRKENETLVQIIQSLYNEAIARRSHLWAWGDESSQLELHNAETNRSPSSLEAR